MIPLQAAILGHAAFQFLRAGVRLGVLDLLRNEHEADLKTIASVGGLADRPAQCLMAALTAMGFVTKCDEGRFACSTELAALTATEWRTLTALVEFEAEIAYEAHGDLLGSLQLDRNVGLQRLSGRGATVYERLATDEQKKRVFYEYMRLWSEHALGLFAGALPLSDGASMLDVGGGDGVAAEWLARDHSTVRVTVLELPEIAPMAAERLRNAEASRRIRVVPCDMFQEQWPGVHSLILFLHQLVIWSEEMQELLLRRAFEALEPGGHVAILSSMANDDGSGPLFTALDSAYFICLAAEGGRIYRWCDYEARLRACGFEEIRRVAAVSWTPHGLVLGRKPAR